MALVTRCSNPACQTLFRVTPAQLQAFGGQVRCGSCSTVFDAFPSLTTVADSALKVQGVSPEPAPMPEPADAEPSSDPAQAADGDSSPLIDGEHVTEWAQDPAQVVVDADAPLQPMAVDHVPDLRDASSLDFVEPGPAESALAPVESIAPEASSPAPASPEQAIPWPSDPVPMTPAAPGPAHAMPSGPTIDAVSRATPELTDYSVGAPAVPGRTTGGTFGRVLGIAIALLLAVLLAGQALHAYRAQIAAHYPASRPLLERLCRIAHCEVGLPKAAHQLVIESSDLQAVDAAKPNLIQLAASVRNKAAIDVAFPAIEVTLTDAQDRPLARRVLLPDQYLAGGKPVDTGLRAGEEFSIRLTLDTTELRPVGYRLYLFYP
jgi:predicted Zn finger-like uncharacterized protein